MLRPRSRAHVWGLALSDTGRGLVKASPPVGFSGPPSFSFSCFSCFFCVIGGGRAGRPLAVNKQGNTFLEWESFLNLYIQVFSLRVSYSLLWLVVYFFLRIRAAGLWLVCSGSWLWVCTTVCVLAAVLLLWPSGTAAGLHLDGSV